MSNQLFLYGYHYDSGKVVLPKKQLRWFGEIILFSTTLIKMVDKRCSFHIDNLYWVKIYPRTSEIRHNPWIMQLTASKHKGK